MSKLKQGKRELLTRQHARFPQLVELHYEGGGELPAILSGLYTSKAEAMQAADFYFQENGRLEESK